ncbi:MAG: DALR anticodon-binding domain-containing protein [Myxococcota bacterium]
MAYHDDKLKRGFGHLINVWGADHGGYIVRVKAGIKALGWEGDPLRVQLVQMVSLSRGGKSVRMGKRLGTAVWLRDVVEEAGRDATRYFFVMRRADSQMDFDIDLATKKSLDNPVYYAQMGHARLASIARRANEAGVATPVYREGVFATLTLPEEIGIIRKMSQAPELVAYAAAQQEPHLVVHYLQDLIADFHSYYSRYKNSERVISDDVEKTQARLLMCRALQGVLRSLLGILGVEAPEEMYLDPDAETLEGH